MPQRGRLNTLLRELAKGEVTFQRAQQILGLKKYPPGTDWYFGKDGLLAVIDTWASVLPKPEAPAGETLDLGSVTTLSDAPALRTASVPALLAATTSETESISANSVAEEELKTKRPKRSATNPERNVSHARKLLVHAGIPTPEVDDECWDAWCSDRGNWRITNYQLHSTNQPDFFNSSAHVRHVLTVRRGTDGPEVTMGPDDAWGLFHDRLDEIDRLITPVEKLRKERHREALAILRLINVFNEDERDSVRAEIEPFRERKDIKGHEDFERIKTCFNRLEEHWRTKCSHEYKALDFLRALDNVTEEVQDLKRRPFGCDMGRFQDSFNQIERSRIIPNFLEHGIPNGKKNIALLVRTYLDLLQYQKARKVIEGYIAAGHRVIEATDRVYATHRGQAALHVLRTLEQGDSSGLRILDFCGNGVLYTVATQLSMGDKVTDLELNTDQSLFTANPNRRKILVDISNCAGENGSCRLIEGGESLFTGKADVVVLNFALNHFEPGQIKDIVISLQSLLKTPESDLQNLTLRPDNISRFPRVIITLPRACSLENSPLEGVLRAAGFVPYVGAEEINSLKSGTRQRISEQRGGDTLGGVNSRVRKPFRVYTLAYTSPLKEDILRHIDSDSFRITKEEIARPSGSENDEDDGKLNPRRIQRELATAALTASDLTTNLTGVVNVSDIVNHADYHSFERKLASLIHFKELLSEHEKAALDLVLDLMDHKFSATIPESLVRFVMRTPDEKMIDYANAPDDFKRIVTTEQPYSLWDIAVVVESNMDQSTGTPNTLLEMHRAKDLRRKIFDELDRRFNANISRFTVIKQFDISLLGFPKTREQLLSIFRGFCLGGETSIFTGRGNVPQYFLIQRAATLRGSSITGTLIIAPSFIARPCDISAYIPKNTPLGERVAIHQANAGLTNEGFVHFLTEQGIDFNSDLLANLKGEKGTPVKVEWPVIKFPGGAPVGLALHYITRALQISPEDIGIQAPAGS